MQGEVVYLYAFDVASEIVTARVGEVFSTRPVTLEIRTQHTLPKDLPLYKPLAVEPPFAASMAGHPVRLLIRIYDVGVISIALRVAFQAESLGALLPFHKGLLDDDRKLDAVASLLCAEVCRSLADVLVEPSPPSEPEAYTVFCLTQLEADKGVDRWLSENRRAVAELLTEAKPNTLSEMQIAEVLRVERSYTTTDLVVIDWDAALIVDLNGYVDDVLYVLELANLQLEEYRMMDQRLDRHLDRAYENLKRRPLGVFGTYSKMLSMLRLFRVDVTKLNDEVTHITKFIGDWYLARVYLGAAERFYLSQWRKSVEDRLGQLDELYTVVNADINNRRMVVLEIIIVIFFAVDLLLIALK